MWSHIGVQDTSALQLMLLEINMLALFASTISWDQESKLYGLELCKNWLCHKHLDLCHNWLDKNLGLFDIVAVLSIVNTWIYVKIGLTWGFEFSTL